MKWLIWLLFPFHVFAALNDVDKAMVWPKNILPNGGFENGRQGWTVSGGTLSTVTSGSNLLTGKVSITWDSNGAGQTLRTSSITIPKGLYGKNGALVCKTQVPSGSATTTMNVDDGTNDLATAQTITTTTTPIYNFLNFIFPSSGSIRIEFTSVAADEPLIVLDDCFLGDADEINLTNISQAQFVGSAYIAAASSCTASVSSATPAALTATSQCLGPTVNASRLGSWSTSDINLMGFVIDNLPSGEYLGRMMVPSNGISSGVQNIALGVGINGTAANGTIYGRSANSSAVTYDQQIIPFHFTRSTAGSVTIEAFAAIATGSITIGNNGTSNPATRLQLDLWRYPTSTEVALRPSTVPYLWTGRHGSDCQWSTNSTTIATPAGDGSCTFTSDYTGNSGSVTSAINGALSLAPGIVYPASSVGLYEVCASINFTSSGGGLTAAFIMTDSASSTTQYDELQGSTLALTGYSSGGRLCGLYQVTSPSSITSYLRMRTSANSILLGGSTQTNQSIRWSIRNLSQAIAAPLLTGSVTTGSSGSSRLEFARITYSAGTPSVNTQSGSWISTVGDNGTGDFTVNIRSGIFSAQPICTCTARSSTSNVICLQDLTTTPSSTLKRFQIFTDAGTAVDDSAEIMCIGPK